MLSHPIQKLISLVAQEPTPERNTAFLDALCFDQELLDGKITDQDLAAVEAAVRQQHPKENDLVAKLLLEGLEICRNNLKIAQKLKVLLEEKHEVKLRPIVSMELHNDGGSWMLLREAFQCLTRHGYRHFMIELPQDRDHAIDSIIRDLQDELKALAESDADYVNNALGNLQRSIDGIDRVISNFSNFVAEDDRLPKSSGFPTTWKQNIFNRNMNMIPFLQLLQASAAVQLTCIDSRSNSDKTDLLTTACVVAAGYMELRDIGFTLQIALYALQGGAVFNVGAGHGAGISERFQRLFPRLPQPMFFFPCHYRVTHDTPNYIIDSIRINMSLIEKTDAEFKSDHYLRLEMAAQDRYESVKLFREFVASQQKPISTALVTGGRRDLIFNVDREEFRKGDHFSITTSVETHDGAKSFMSKTKIFGSMASTNFGRELLAEMLSCYRHFKIDMDMFAGRIKTLDAVISLSFLGQRREFCVKVPMANRFFGAPQPRLLLTDATVAARVVEREAQEDLTEYPELH